jgi:hypothetical protein
MAKIVVGAKAEETPPPLEMKIHLEIDVSERIWPSTVLATDDETLSGEAVLELLAPEYILSTGEGLLGFLYDQSWFDAAKLNGWIEIK